MNIFKTFFLGVGLALGSGLVYALFTSEVARILFLVLLAFLLGGAIIGIVVLVINRQWTQALGTRRSQTTNRYELLSPPSYPPAQYPAQSQFFYNPDSLPMIDGGEMEPGDDRPVA